MNLSDAIGLEIERREPTGYCEHNRGIKGYASTEMKECPYCHIDQLEQRIEELSDPGWKAYIALTEKWLEKYPADIFTGVSGDPGPLFVVAIRNALAALLQEPTP